MNSVISRIENNHFWKFHGGIHPPEQKFLTNDKPIKPISLPELLIIPIQQHIGVPGDILVSQGDRVLKGQALTIPSVPMAVPVHAPTSGTIEKIALHTIAHPSGLSELCVFLKPDGKDKWRERNFIDNYHDLTRKEIISRISSAGISGMGGAGFPTHIKVDSKPNIDFLIINAAECEPYITADDLLIREQSATIVEGIKILKHLLIPKKILIGIEDNKPESIKVLQNATKDIAHIQVCVLPTKYPSGGEKQLIKILTGQEITSGTLPIHQGIVMQNIATCFAISEAVLEDIPLIRRVVTVTGQALEKPQNIWAAIGTQVKDLISSCHSSQPQNQQHIIMGGPMMGFTLPIDTVPIVKTTNCVLVPSQKELATENTEVECIRCGQCADVCPSNLLPQEMQWSAKAKDYDKLNELNLFDCIDCGACAYVCPSHIPLVQYYRVAKAEIRQQQLQDIKAEKAKARFEARKARLERDKKAREEKQRKASEARKAAMNNKTNEGGTAKSAVAAALARVKAKKAQQKDPANVEEQSIENNSAAKANLANDDKKSQVAAAIARAKAKKAAKNSQPSHNADDAENSTKVNNAEKNSNSDNNTLESKQTEPQDKKAKVAAAVAEAKAKKLAQKNDEASNQSKPQDKKAKVAAAVAKAKAKKLAQKNAESAVEVEESSSIPTADAPSETINTVVVKNTENANDIDDKKARIAKAVAKAKAKKQAGQESSPADKKTANNDQGETQANVNENSSVENDSVAKDTAENATEAVDDKKIKIAAAIAKAKAKKKQAEAKSSEENSAAVSDTANQVSNEKSQEPLTNDNANSEDALTPEEAKKKRIAAAVAKAKAKKQQRTESN